ncbi:UDP-glucose dehydrogenase family protein [Megamonas hypermegale]|uniref:UDP-glucose dehydrogenase family protein n=1 Tax=Megamonas hypermegale TaxID=158847 RepID=UPI00195F17E7|nr:UDP-glucose/GDP-mannose dehydrogenase family protein [Megamonas hypermegale]MBM6832746.1 UDP-glucose/GDP-mannose dehydrogenase family protein [Megamonas hypermegale]
MRVAMIGTGYVGLVTGTCFAATGNNVICVDVVKEKIDNLNKGIIPIFEPGLDKMVKSAQERGNLSFTTDIKEALQKSDICFIAVGTPMGEDGSADLQYVINAAREIGKYMVHDMYIVDKSTVPVGTGDLVRSVVQEELAKRDSDLYFDVISNPEFLKEGNACQDFMHPDRVVIGSENPKSIEVMQELYEPFIRSSEFFVTMDIKSAELTKYAANAMLATKISFINEIANISEKVGANINKVRRGIASDSRIGYSFLNPGCGYGGSCFPKDVKALIKTSRQYNYEPELLSSVENVNARQKMVLVNKVVDVFGEDLKGKTFAVWGLAFKPGTDDMREAPAIRLIEELTKRGAFIRAYDPQAMKTAKNFYLKDIDNIMYIKNKYDALDDVDALIVVTEWKEFQSPDFMEIADRMKGDTIFDGRNIYKAKTVLNHNLKYYQIGVQKKNMVK